MSVTMTAVSNPRDKNRSDRVLALSFPGPASYTNPGPTGGESADFEADLGTAEPEATIRCENLERTHFGEWDTVNQVWRLFTGGAEVANGVNLSAITFQAVVLLPY